MSIQDYKNVKQLKDYPLKITIAKNKETNKKVIIKQLNENSTWEQVALLENEINILKNIHHPFISKLIEYSGYSESSNSYLIRDFVEGTTLDPQAEYSRTHFTEITEQIIDILIYLEQQKPSIIHHDIKPSNLIWNEKNIYLIDFGIAKETSDKTIGLTTQFGGTSGFIAPEKFLGKKADTRSDLYSLGIVLGCILSKTSAKDAKNIVNDNFELKPINSKYDYWLQKLTSCQPDSRYQTVREAKEALLETRNKSSISSIQFNSDSFWQKGNIYIQNNNYFFKNDLDNNWYVLPNKKTKRNKLRHREVVMARWFQTGKPHRKYNMFSCVGWVKEIRRVYLPGFANIERIQKQQLRKKNRYFIYPLEVLEALKGFLPTKDKQDRKDNLKLMGTIIQRGKSVSKSKNHQYILVDFKFVFNDRNEIIKKYHKIKILIDKTELEDISFWLVPYSIDSVDRALNWLEGKGSASLFELF